MRVTKCCAQGSAQDRPPLLSSSPISMAPRMSVATVAMAVTRAVQTCCSRFTEVLRSDIDVWTTDASR